MALWILLKFCQDPRSVNSGTKKKRGYCFFFLVVFDCMTVLVLTYFTLGGALLKARADDGFAA